MADISVTQKLQEFRKSQKQEDPAEAVSKIRLITLEALSKEKISFGKAKIGQPFPEVFKD